MVNELFAQHKDYSEATAVTIDTEVRKFVDDAYEKALTLLRDNREKLHAVANALLEREILDGAEIKTLLTGGQLAPPGQPKQPEKTPSETDEKKVSNDRPDEAPGHAGGEPSPSPA